MIEEQSDRHRTLLDARSAALAARGLERRHEGPRQSFLVCRCGSELIGLPLTAAASVLAERPCTPMPGTPDALRGIIFHAGAIICVFDLAKALQIERGDRPASGHFVRLRAQIPLVALAVDRVLGVARVATSDVALHSASLDPAQAGDDTVTGSAPQPGLDLGTDAILGYVQPGSSLVTGIADGFSIIDLPRLLRRFLS